MAFVQVGASNELPESEELDALYDRFLIRRSVSQVSSSQLANLARLAAGSRLVAEPSSNGASSNGAGTPSANAQGPGLDLEDFRYGHDQVLPLLCTSCRSLIVLLLWWGQDTAAQHAYHVTAGCM